MSFQTWLALALLLLVCAVLWLGWRLKQQASDQKRVADELVQRMESSLANGHRAMLNDLYAGLERLGDRINTAQSESAERLRTVVTDDLRATREAMQALHLALQALLNTQRDEVNTKLAEFVAKTLHSLSETARADRELLQDGLRGASAQMGASIEILTRTINERLDAITGVVNQRLDEGFKKTNETFANVMARLATIDEAQKKIGDLTVNVVSLQELLGDKKARGAFGEVQLEALIQNALPPDAYQFQATLASGARVDCLLRLPEPTGMVAVDAKFPLENYHRMFDPSSGDLDRKAAQSAFRLDVRRHVDAIASKYIVPGETSDGAVMFIPAEAVFAEIHAYHPEVVSYAQGKRVWIVSPTTLMAVLNTVRAVLKDVETRKQIHVIKDALGKLSADFLRFDERMKRLADQIRRAHEETQQVHTSSQKIVKQFERIESVQLDDEPKALGAPGGD